jgi:hypothetical protein
MAGNSSDCPLHEVHMGVVLTVRHNFHSGKEPSVDFVQFCTGIIESVQFLQICIDLNALSAVFV